MDSPYPRETPPSYKRSLAWNIGFSSFWFATSYKWFILLFILLPGQVESIVPGGEKNTYWGLIFGTGAVWAIFGPSIFGRLNETLTGVWRNRRLWLALGSAGTLVALATLYNAPNLWILGLGYLLLQISDDLGTGPYSGMVADTVPPEHRGFASAVLGGLKLFGQIASAIAALALGRLELIYIGIGLVNVLCMLWTVYTIKDVAEPPVSKTLRGNIFQDWLAPFRSSDFVRVWFNRLIVAFAFACVSAYTRNFLTDMFTVWELFGRDLGSANTAAQVLALTISFSGILGAVLSSKISDRTGRKPLLIVSALIITASLFPIAFAKGFTPIWVCVFFFGIGNGIYASNDWAIASDVLPNPERASTEMGVWQSSETAVQIPAGVIMGFLIDQLNRQSFGLGYQTMVIIASLLFLVSIALIKGIKKVR